MSEVAQLITAIAALVTAIGGASAAIIVALQSLARQRTAAAEEAARLIGRRGHASGGSGEPQAAHRHRANNHRPRAGGALEAEVRREVEFEDLELTRELARDARDIARDIAREARELALESQRDARFHDLEHPPEQPPAATHGDGVDA